MNRSDDLFPQPNGTPDPHWQRAFEGAHDPPPPRVWEGVERQLDLDDADGILPLWQHRQGRQSMLFGRWAAGIAASLALTLLGWWAWHREGALRPDAAVAVAPAPPRHRPGPIVSTPSVARPGTVPAVTLDRLVTGAGKPPRRLDDVPDRRLSANSPVSQRKYFVDKQKIDGEIALVTAQTERRRTGVESQMPPASSQPNMLVAGPAMDQPAMANVLPALAERVSIAVTLLNVTGLVNRPVGNERIVWYQTEPSATEPAGSTAKKQRQQPWVSAGVMASAFNPVLGLRSSFSPVAATAQSSAFLGNVAPASAPMLHSQAGRAVAVQAGVGIPLGEHWSVETGLGYLRGQNDVQSPARVSASVAADKATGSGNLYVDIVSRSTPQVAIADYSPSGLATANRSYEGIANNQASDYNRQQTVSNVYQFVQVPVQVGYEFRPRRKFGLALLTGLVSNWFVRNTVAETVTVRPGDGLYRPLTLAGTAGMRLRYRPDAHWSASVAGTFQQSLHSLTRTDVGLQALPQQTGLSFSVDRHF